MGGPLQKLHPPRLPPPRPPPLPLPLSLFLQQTLEVVARELCACGGWGLGVGVGVGGWGWGWGLGLGMAEEGGQKVQSHNIVVRHTLVASIRVTQGHPLHIECVRLPDCGVSVRARDTVARRWLSDRMELPFMMDRPSLGSESCNHHAKAKEGRWCGDALAPIVHDCEQVL